MLNTDFVSFKLLRSGNWIGMGMALLATVTVAWFSFQAVQNLARRASWIAHSDQVIQTLWRLESVLFETEDKARAYAAQPDDRFLKTLAGDRAAIADDLKALERLTADNRPQQQRLHALAPIIKGKLQAIEHDVAAAHAHGAAAAIDALRADSPVWTIEDIATRLRRMQDEENQLLSKRMQRRSAAESSITLTIVAGSGVIIFFVFCAGVILDYTLATLQRSVEERIALERMARRDEALTAMGVAIAGVAHELNNPLAIVASRAELLQATPGPNTDAQLREDLAVIQRNAQRAASIAAELLSSARRRSLEFAAVNLAELIETTIDPFREQLRREKIDINVALDPKPRLVSGDRIALEQVFVNLLSNAREAMPHGGAIEITSRPAAGKPNCVEIAFKDTGEGIPQDVLPRIFDVFYTTKPKGTGMGLWLCRRIILGHKGALEAESCEGGGTTFRLSLPLATEN